jgi:integrase
MPRKQLPISQRHRKNCARRDCDCPWTGRVRLPDGSMPRFGGDTYPEAEDAYYKLMARRPEPLADRTTTIEQWARRWLDSGKSRGWRPETLRVRRYVVPRNVLSEMGHYLVTELRRDDVRLWVARMRDRGTTTATMIQAIETLRSMYSAWLKDDRLLPRGIPVPPGLVKEQPRKQFTPLTAAEVHALATAMPPDMRVVVTAQSFYGTRVSEILALREEDMTWTGRDLLAPLGAQLARLAELPADKYAARRPRLRFDRKQERDGTAGPVKNRRGHRDMPLPQWLAADLGAQLARWPAVNGWLFTNPRLNSGRGAGSDPLPLRIDAYQTWLEKAARKAGITLPPNQCTHALRHHAVSVLRASGWNDHDIGEWIGDSAQTVAATYGRPMPDALDKIAAHLSMSRETAGAGLRAVD